MAKTPEKRDTAIRELKLSLKFWRTIENVSGQKVDMYIISDASEETCMTIGVAHGRADIAKFAYRCMLAGQATMIRYMLSNPEDLYKLWNNTKAGA